MHDAKLQLVEAEAWMTTLPFGFQLLLSVFSSSTLPVTDYLQC